MTLRSRLTLLVAALVCGVAVLMGGSAVQVAYLTGLHTIDESLDAVADTAAAAKTDGLTSTLYAASVQQLPIAVALRPMEGAPTWLQLGEGLEIADSPIRVYQYTATGQLIEDAQFRVRSVTLADGDSVVLAVDLRPLQTERATNLRVVFAISLLLALFAAACSRLLVRRDLERIRQLTASADRIAAGDLSEALPASVGVSEVDELAGALGRMLASLTGSFEELRASHTQLRTFLGDVSHELRTPLTVVRGYVELLENHEQLDAATRNRAVARSLAEIERMQALIADLLLLAEFAERPNPTLDSVDFSGIVRDSVVDLMALQPQRPLTVDMQDEEVRIVGDRRALESVCANLFGNIRRHTPETAAVHVGLTVADGTCRLVIEDGGPGLTEAQYAVDVDDLQRFNRMRSETTGGSGLGLRIVATVMRMHRGTLRLLPSDAGGLRVECSLPVGPGQSRDMGARRHVAEEDGNLGA